MYILWYHSLSALWRVHIMHCESYLALPQCRCIVFCIFFDPSTEVFCQWFFHYRHSVCVWPHVLLITCFCVGDSVRRLIATMLGILPSSIVAVCKWALSTLEGVKVLSTNLQYQWLASWWAASDTNVVGGEIEKYLLTAFNVCFHWIFRPMSPF